MATNSTALTVQKKPKHTRRPAADKRRRRMPAPGPKDMQALFLKEQGLSVAEIAQKMNRRAFEVQASLDYMDEWKFQNQISILNTHTISVLMAEIAGVGKVVRDGMQAEKVIHVDRETGKIKKAPDHAMRLNTVETIRSLMETMSPKTPLLQNNQQFNFGAAGASGMVPGMSFERMLRAKREQAGLANEQEVETVDAVTVEDEIADEFAEFGGDEDDEDGDAE